jgi:hypothetical protein
VGFWLLRFRACGSAERNAKEVSSDGLTHYLPRYRAIGNVLLMYLGTADGGTVVKVLCYKSEGRWFDFRWCHWNFSLT